jgi:hypothetical protein
MTKSNVGLHIWRALRLVLGMFIASAILMSSNGYAADATVIRLNDGATALVTISGRGTVLSFPMKPTKVILGKANSFGIEYCESDLAISPLSPSARSHLYVYLYGRRFSFDLVTSMDSGHAVILVRDAKEIPIKVKRHE